MVPFEHARQIYTSPTSGNAVTPLVEAEEAFTALERACQAARETIHLCYRIIDPEFPLLLDEDEERRWVDLLVDRVKDGVEVRILMADFDEFVATDMHREARKRFVAFQDARKSLNDDERSRFEVLCVQHRARIGQVSAVLAWPATRRLLIEQVDVLNHCAQKNSPQEAEQLLELSPELSEYIYFDEQKERFERSFFPPHRVRPATHHEKLAVIDSRICFVGGIDVCDMTFDTAEHERNPAWHDIGYRIEGPAAQGTESYFQARWADAIEQIGNDASTPDQPEGHDRHVMRGDNEPWLRLVATRSVDRRGPFARTPKPQITDIRDCVYGLIGQAKEFLYIENQFLRDLALVRKIAERAREVPELTAVVVLPFVPIRSIEDERIDEAAAHGLALQEEAIEILEKAFGSRIGIFTLAGHQPVNHDGLDVVEDSRIVYVHSKLLIVDDRLAFAGSANFNGRSFLCDSELGFEWHAPDDIRKLRLRLWDQLLGEPEVAQNWQPPDFPGLWRGVAERNAALDPRDRKGFAVPYPAPEERPEARKHWIIPDALV